MRTRLNRFFFFGSRIGARRLVNPGELLRIDAAPGRTRFSAPFGQVGRHSVELINLAEKNPNE